MRQNYEKAFLQSILDQYPDLGAIIEHRLFTTGYENSNYYVETEKGRFVVKIFEGMVLVPENIAFEVEVMGYLSDQGLKVPKVFKNKLGNLESKAGEKQAVLMSFVEGQNMDRQILTDELVAEAGTEAGKMDAVLKKFTDGSKTRQNYEFDLKNTLILEPSLKFVPSDFDVELLKKVFEEFRIIKPELDMLPKGLMQNDIVPHNFLVKDGKLEAIIDFSDLAFSPYVQNIAVALHLTCFAYNWNPEQVKIFISAYLKENPLPKSDFEYLFVLVKARFLSFILEFNRWNVEYAVDQHRVETVRDHYNFLKRFIDFGESNFNTLLGEIS